MGFRQISVAALTDGRDVNGKSTPPLCRACAMFLRRIGLKPKDSCENSLTPIKDEIFRNKSNCAIFIYFELLRKRKLETMYSLRCSLRLDESHSGDSSTWLQRQSGGCWLLSDWRKLILSYFHEVMKNFRFFKDRRVIDTSWKFHADVS